MGTTYETVKATVKRHCRIHDGYNGNTAVVGLAFLRGRAVFVADSGYFKANSQPYQDEAEMLYYFDQHRSVHFPQVIRLEPDPSAEPFMEDHFQARIF